MRIDKFLSEMGVCSRSEASKLAKKGELTVDGLPVKRTDAHIEPGVNEVRLKGELIGYKKFTYIMLNKPDGYISATEDGRESTVLELLGERERKLGLFPVGRLDKNTTGLLILTNDGELSHRLLSPKFHVAKVYAFTAERRITEDDRRRLEAGVKIDDFVTKPAKVELSDDCSGRITITEGKFHQVKRMLEAVCNKIVTLERVEFAGIPLDTSLGRGDWRELTDDEVAALREKAN